ncbi:hypothetical protein D8674_008953 [Pyrus ussuriensis x Pyrus communis]|uniref:Uncharacterized protein n=1 Tax=Pyrus ussuriensis x Pyrus communis TaxID=2448454 RepID=A0A5N5I782_9ROSA|nr:hypothetical protein D8674_008953 [Pyrus ussuriensis x Pyrus communis]
MVSFLSMTNSVLTWHVEDLVSGFVWEIEFKLNCKKVVQILGFRYENVTVVENIEKMVGSYLPADKGSFWFWHLRYLSRVSLAIVEFVNFGSMN